MARPPTHTQAATRWSQSASSRSTSSSARSPGGRRGRGRTRGAREHERRQSQLEAVRAQARAGRRPRRTRPSSPGTRRRSASSRRTAAGRRRGGRRRAAVAHWKRARGRRRSPRRPPRRRRRWGRGGSGARPRRHVAPEDGGPHDERADDDRECGEQRPAGEIVLPRRPARARGLRGWRRGDPDADVVDAGRKWPSAPVARQRTVYHEPRTSPETVAVTTRPSADSDAAPEWFTPSGPARGRRQGRWRRPR